MSLKLCAGDWNYGTSAVRSTNAATLRRESDPHGRILRQPRVKNARNGVDESMTILVFRAFQDLIFYELLTKLGGFPRIRRCVQKTARSGRIAGPDTVKNVVEAVDIASCFYFREVKCLHRSFVAVRMLRKMGVAAELIIATRPLPFLSHAWVEVDNEIVNDKPGYKRKLLVMDRI